MVENWRQLKVGGRSRLSREGLSSWPPQVPNRQYAPTALPHFRDSYLACRRLARRIHEVWRRVQEATRLLQQPSPRRIGVAVDAPWFLSGGAAGPVRVGAATSVTATALRFGANREIDRALLLISAAYEKVVVLDADDAKFVALPGVPPSSRSRYPPTVPKLSICLLRTMADRGI